MNDLMDAFSLSLDAHTKYIANRIDNPRNKAHFLSTIQIIEQTAFYMNDKTMFGFWLANAKIINELDIESYTLFSSPYKYRKLAYEISQEIYKTLQNRLYGTYQNRQ